MAEYQSRTPGADLTGYLTRYPQELVFGDEDTAAVFSRYHTDDLVLRNDGLALTKDRLVAHARAGRRNAAQVHIEIHDLLSSAEHVAARYTLTAVMRRGHVIATRIHMFGELAPDGRLRRIEQLTRDVSAQQSVPTQNSA